MAVENGENKEGMKGEEGDDMRKEGYEKRKAKEYLVE